MSHVIVRVVEGFPVCECGRWCVDADEHRIHVREVFGLPILATGSRGGDILDMGIGVNEFEAERRYYEWIDSLAHK